MARSAREPRSPHGRPAVRKLGRRFVDCARTDGKGIEIAYLVSLFRALISRIRSTCDGSGVENRGAGTDFLNRSRGMVRTIPEALYPVPVGIVPRRHGLSNARWGAKHKADMPISIARVAELRESPVFK